MKVYKQILISGSVQGVFFRDSTRQIATELKLTGGVRNLADGRVEVQVEGDEASVQSLIKWLKIGPKLAKVSTIKVIDLDVLEMDSACLPGKQKGRFEIWFSQV